MFNKETAKSKPETAARLVAFAAVLVTMLAQIGLGTASAQDPIEPIVPIDPILEPNFEIEPLEPVFIELAPTVTIDMDCSRSTPVVAHINNLSSTDHAFDASVDGIYVSGVWVPAGGIVDLPIFVDEDATATVTISYGAAVAATQTFTVDCMNSVPSYSVSIVCDPSVATVTLYNDGNQASAFTVDLDGSVVADQSVGPFDSAPVSLSAVDSDSKTVTVSADGAVVGSELLSFVECADTATDSGGSATAPPATTESGGPANSGPSTSNNSQGPSPNPSPEATPETDDAEDDAEESEDTESADEDENEESDEPEAEEETDEADSNETGDAGETAELAADSVELAVGSASQGSARDKNAARAAWGVVGASSVALAGVGRELSRRKAAQ